MDQIDLEARYRATSGTVMLTGIQALVRVIFDQIRADRLAGRRTGAFVSGYQGSPLGTFDLTLARTGELLDEHDVTLLPGVNEDIAATSVWGSQQDHIAPLARHDGVIGMWYGKGPGVDRSGDAFRHANLHGIGRGGGVIAAAGDDPAAKSSTLPHGSEVALYDAGMPVLTPGTPQEVLDLGRHGYEMSRFSGCWSGLKVVTAVADGFGAVDVDLDRLHPVRPDLEFGGVPWQFTQRPMLFLPDSLELEKELYDRRHPAALAYARANHLNAVEVDPADAWLTIVSPGRTYREVRQALADLGLPTDDDVARAGIRLLRLGLVYPLDHDVVRYAARGVRDVLVVEEKRAFVELFVREALYGGADRPALLGKRDTAGRPLIPADGELAADRLVPILRPMLQERLGDVVQAPPALEVPRQLIPLSVSTATRRAAFCSGCPHNRSTVEASGSPVGAGVGCHAMVLWADRGAVSYSQMGGEGAQWLGRAPFTDVPHWVQNVGDGTFFHSASLVVRAAAAAKARMTFKLLYNGTVAMTGGQDPAGQASIRDLVAAMSAEGVARTIVVSDEPRRHGRTWLSRRRGWPPHVEVWHRDRLPDAERALAAVDGVTLLVYDQGCAAELRRMRKRGTAPVRSRRVVINEAVCEGCGDCGAKSSCLSVHPVPTEFGRKTQIDQTSCNTDYSCLDGNCPSFVTVEAPSARQRRKATAAEQSIPDPVLPRLGQGEVFSLVAVGIGGTGVVTLNQMLAAAAFAEGLVVRGLDQTGLSQKGGPVVSHLVLSRDETVGANAVGAGRADLYLALDAVAATDERFLAKVATDRTATVASSSVVPTISMVLGEAAPDGAALLASLAARSRPDAFVALDANGLAETALGDAATANTVVLGAAYQAGRLPLQASSIEAAIRANGVAVDANLAAFRLGRSAVHAPANVSTRPRVGALARTPSLAATAVVDELLGSGRRTSDLARRRAAELVDYQGARLARRFLDLVAEVDDTAPSLTDTVAASFFHLLAYKDEYEVARLHLLADFHDALGDAVPGGTSRRYWLQPPLLRSMGMTRKVALPAWCAEPAFKTLRAMRRVRGTPVDLFGHTAVRRVERRLADEYEADIRALLPHVPSLDPDAVTSYAALPLEVRGYEEIKLAAVERYERERDERRLALLDPRQGWTTVESSR